MKALNRIGRLLEDLKERVNPGQLQYGGRPFRQAGKFEVTVSFHNLLHTVEEHLHASTVHVANRGEVEHETRTLDPEETPYFAKKQVGIPHYQVVWELKHDNRPVSKHFQKFLSQAPKKRRECVFQQYELTGKGAEGSIRFRLYSGDNLAVQPQKYRLHRVVA